MPNDFFEKKHIRFEVLICIKDHGQKYDHKQSSQSGYTPQTSPCRGFHGRFFLLEMSVAQLTHTCNSVAFQNHPSRAETHLTRRA
jgi:hypothetical protein